MYMKGFAGLVSFVLGVAALAVSCSKDKVKGTLEFEVSAVFMQAGDEAVVRFFFEQDRELYRDAETHRMERSGGRYRCQDRHDRLSGNLR